MKEIIQLQKVRKQMKELKQEETNLVGVILAWLKEQNAKKAKTPYGTISIASRKVYHFTDEVGEAKLELKSLEEKEKERALSRKEWEELGRPDVPMFDESEHIRFVEAKEGKEQL